ncbi:K02A2.6-like, partial [Cordylochernes scorpioides]
MASSTGNSLQPFVPGTNPSEAWGKWKKRFQMFYIATEIDKKSIPRQRAILLYNIGELALDIYSTFKIQETDASPTVPDILELFDGHFKPYKNTTYKRYQFFTTEQGENQNFDDYVTELKNKSMDCEFGELADSLVRDRIIIGIKDKALKERMLQDPDLSLAKAIDLGRATETSRQQVKNITREDVDLHSIKYKKQYKKNFKYPVGRKPNVSEEHPNAKVCQNCGSRHPYGKCFAYGKICNSCKKPNHFAKMCRNRVHMLEERAEEEEEMCLQYLSLDSITGLEWTKIILVENNSVNFKLDTGAQVNILPLDTIKNWQNKPCIYPTGIAVYSYTGEKVPIRGKCKASCTSGKKSEILEFLVVDLPAPPILGLAACKKLELILKVESLEQDHTRTKMDASPTKIIESYRDVFDEIGTLPGEHSVILRENAHPRIQLARRIPFALKKPVEMELKSMEEQKIISKVDQPAEWAHPMVIIKKPNGKVRICMDPRELNPWIKMEYRQLPAPEGIIADITKSPIYTVLDAKSAFWQIKLDEKSSSLLTMATPYGYYRFHRLPFGICSAPEVFYKKMQSMFTGIEGVKVYMDDIIIYGNSLTEHNSRLITVLEIARKNNLKFEFNKMQLAQEKVKFIGHEISKNGISADPSKLEAIQKIKRPMDKTSLQRFLGTVNYLAKFMHNLADKTVLLRQLLKKNTLWTWNEAIEKEFIELKNLVSNPPVLGLFDPHRKVTLSVDASQHGLGAVLMQEGRPIAFASASLNNTQKKYAQIEKELLALWYGCQRFNYHLYGRKFTAQTDHKPLLAILKKPLEELSPRLERLVLKLMRYDFNLEYVPGKVIHTADTLSRDSISEETIDTSDLDLQNTIMTLNLKVTTKRYQEILRDMESDEEMIKLRDHILNGWPIHKKSVDYAVKPYWHCKEELYIWKDLICRGQRLVIPKVQRESILQTLHMSHQGISACKNRAHEAIYWPGLDREIEEMVYKCRICQESQPSQRKEPLIPHEIADYPWQKVAIDFFYLDQSVFIIIVDYYSSFPEVIKVASTSAKEILPVLKSTFARHGIPEIIITDNGPPFTSQDFTNFTNEWDIEHKTSSPGYPKSNGLVERMVQTVKKQLKKCRQDNTDPYMCLIALRTTPSNNLPSPAQMLMGRNLRTLIPMKTTKLKPAFISTENILQQKRENQYKMKEYYDRNAKILPKMSSGEQVNAKTSNAWRPATIIGEANQPRSYIIQNNEGRMLKRNRVHLRPRSYPVGQRRSSQSSPQLDPAPSTSSESSGQREPGEFPRLNLSPEELAPSTSTPIGNYNEGGTAYTTRSGRVFDGTNYQIWKYQIEIILRQQGVLDLVEGIDVKPEEESQKVAWNKRNDKAMVIISTAIVYKQLEHLITCDTAQKQWTRLKSIYEQISTTSLLAIQQQFYSYKMNEKDAMSNHISKIEGLIKQLCELGEKVSEAAFMAKVLGSLLSKYAHFLTAWDSVTQTEQTKENLIARLIQEEIRLDQKDQQDDATAFKATANYNWKKNKTCNYCKRPGHFWAECRNRLRDQKQKNKNSLQPENRDMNRSRKHEDSGRSAFICENEACKYGKQQCQSFRSIENKQQYEVGELIHSDLCGPMESQSLGGSNYFLLFKDDQSAYRVVYFIRHKSDVFTKFKEFDALIKNQFGRSVKIFRTDNGTEYVNQSFLDYLRKNGIIHERSAPYTPQQNGFVERDLRTILGLSRSMLHDSGLEKNLWAEAVNTAVYVLNRTLSNNEKTPLELWSGRKSTFKHFKIFGSEAYANIPKHFRSKWDSKTKKMIFVGYEHTSKNYRLYDPKSGQIVVCRNVTVREPNPVDTCDTQMKIAPISIESEGSSQHQDEDSTQEETCGPTHSYNLRPRKTSQCDVASAWIAESLEPVTYEEAMSSKDKINWEIAMNEEKQALIKNKTWELMDLPDNAKAIGCKWIFRIKRKGNGEIDRYRARLVAKGFSQRRGIDYKETFAPVVRYDSVRVLLALATAMDMEIMQFDIKTAFLNGDLDEDIYMQIPEGIEVENKNLVCKLKKSLYRLKQSPRIWNEKFTYFLKQFQLTQSQADPCVFYQTKTDAKIFLALYVDDGTPVDPNMKLTRENINDTHDMHNVPYAEAIGCLMFLAVCTRPDIAFAVNNLSRFMAAPVLPHWNALKRIFKYLKGTLDSGILYKRKDVIKLIGYSDSDFAGDIDTRRSTSGYIFLLAGGPVTWTSQRQSVVALSTTEAEYIAASMASREAENSSLFDITIYTDGSQLETGLSGSGIAIYKDKILEKISLSHPRHLSVYKSELSSIDTALKDININSPSKITIYSDSRAAIYTLQSCFSSQEPLLKSIAKSLNRLPANSSVTVQWLPAHVGIPGNELADSLANALGLPEARESTTQLDERDLLRTIKTQCLQEWKSDAAHDWYRAGGTSTGSVLPREQQSLISRLKSGHLRTMTFQKGCRVFSLCTKCNSQPATPRHIIDCIDSSIDELYSSPGDTIKNLKLYKLDTLVSQNTNSYKVRQIVGSPEPEMNQEFVIQSVENTNLTEDWYEEVKIKGKKVNMKLDTGAQCNVLPLSLAGRLNLEIQRSPVKSLISFSGHRIPVEGQSLAMCMVKNMTAYIRFIISRDNTCPILGRQTCSNLGLVKRVNTCQTITQEYQELFEGIGCLKGYEYEAKFQTSDMNMQVRPPRPIPLSIKERVKKELEEMEDNGIIKKVNYPTPISSQMVIAKQKGKIRICIDPSDINKVILRSHFPLRTFDQIAVNLHGSKYFTKLDLKKGYWQIKVAPNSQRYFTFSTPWGRYMFLRVPFGIKTAPEIFQKIMADLLQDLEGTENSMDDILIQRIFLQIQQYDLRIKYKKGKELLTADLLSRDCSYEDTYLEENFEVLMTTPTNKSSYEELQALTKEDQELKNLIFKDNYSGFIDFKEMKTMNYAETIESLKKWFSVHGIPRLLETDNGPNFTSRDFKDFQKKWLFDHQTSIPLYPKSNGLAERAVQTAKNLIKKCLDSGQEVELALLNFYNTPRDGLPSPAQCLFSRRTRTLLPTSTHQLEPGIQKGHTQNLRNKREKQKTHHDKTAKTTRSFKEGEKIMLKQHHREWIPARVTQEVAPRSYKVQTPTVEYRRNSSFMRHTNLESPKQQRRRIPEIPKSTLPEGPGPSGDKEQAQVPEELNTSPRAFSGQEPRSDHQNAEHKNGTLPITT